MSSRPPAVYNHTCLVSQSFLVYNSERDTHRKRETSGFMEGDKKQNRTRNSHGAAAATPGPAARQTNQTIHCPSGVLPARYSTVPRSPATHQQTHTPDVSRARMTRVSVKTGELVCKPRHFMAPSPTPAMSRIAVGSSHIPEPHRPRMHPAAQTTSHADWTTHCTAAGFPVAWATPRPRPQRLRCPCESTDAIHQTNAFIVRRRPLSNQRAPAGNSYHRIASGSHGPQHLPTQTCNSG